MGGGYYDRDVYSVPTSSGASAYSDHAEQVFERRRADPDVDPEGRQLACDHTTPVVVAMDVTGSMGNWSKIVYDKMPMFYGQIMLQGYLDDPALSFAAVGDVNADQAPLQVTGFAQGTSIDEWLQKLWLEGGGGAGFRESYELAAYYYARRVALGSASRGFLFFTGDEGFYDVVRSARLSQLLGVEHEQDVETRDVFKELCERYEVFLLHKRYKDPDAEGMVLAQWRQAIGRERVLLLPDPKAVVDVMLGVLAVVGGARDLPGYLEDMRARDQTEERVETVREVLAGLVAASPAAAQPTSLPPASGPRRGGRARRL
jgi:hypothetical protein